MPQANRIRSVAFPEGSKAVKNSVLHNRAVYHFLRKRTRKEMWMQDQKQKLKNLGSKEAAEVYEKQMCRDFRKASGNHGQ